ncbi:MAG: hypothetical protein IJE79_02055 [Alphaproteobacteria bacterium]|nr:hypothetical protein [Alphaproteobacteria bacterium]
MPKNKTNSIKKPYFITDSEKSFKPNSRSIIDLNKETEDLLNASIYSNAIKKAIENAPIDNGTFIIGIFGEWGIGKSTIIKNIKEELESQAKRKKCYKFIIYDAWKFVKDSFRRSFLLYLVDALLLNKTPYMEKIYQNKTEETNITVKYNSKKFWYFTVFPWILSLVSIVCIWAYGTGNDTLKIISSIIFPFISLIINSLGKIFDELKTTKQTPAIFSAEQFTECFAEILAQSLKKTNFIKRICNWVNGTPTYDKLIIVIDNIDRCSADTTYELLSTIKTFLINHDNLILVIPVDEVALCEHLQSRFDNKPDRAKEFLRKIFNLEVRIKPLDSVELYEFTNKINQDYDLDFSPDAIDIISKEYATNPRRIIQFFNNAQTEWDIVTQRIKNFSPKDTILARNTMCKLLIIREEWPFYYEQIRKDPKKLLSGKYTNKPNEQNNLALDTFLRSTEFYPILTDEFKLNRIISNNNMFDALPIQTLEDLKSFDIPKLTAFIKASSENETKTFKYLETQIKNAIKRNITGTTATLFKFILQINRAIGGLSEQNNIRLQTILNEHVGPIVSTILEKTPIEHFADELIEYINAQNQSKRTYLFHEIMNNCIIPTIKIPQTYEKYTPTNTDLLYAKLITSITDKKLFDKYKKHFCLWKQYISDDIVNINNIAATDLQYFITNDFQEELINGIKLTENDETTHLDTIIHLLNNYRQNKSLIQNIFSKLNTIYPNYTVGQKSKSIKFLKNVLELLKVIKPQNIGDELHSLIKKLLYSRTYGQTIVTHETYADKDEYIKMIDILCKLLNFSLDNRSSYNAQTELNTLLISYLERLINRNIELQTDLLHSIKTNITNPQASIYKLANLIFGKKIYNNDYCSIMKDIVVWHYSNRDINSPEYWCIADNALATEIHNLLSELKTSNTTQKTLFQDLIDYLSKKRKNCIDSVLQTINDCAIIANLPSQSKIIAMQHIYTNLHEYESNTMMLKLVAQNADVETIKNLVEGILLKKMLSPDTKEMALEIFDSIPKNKSTKYRRKINALK